MTERYSRSEWEAELKRRLAVWEEAGHTGIKARQLLAVQLLAEEALAGHHPGSEAGPGPVIERLTDAAGILASLYPSENEGPTPRGFRVIRVNPEPARTSDRAERPYATQGGE